MKKIIFFIFFIFLLVTTISAENEPSTKVVGDLYFQDQTNIGKTICENCEVVVKGVKLEVIDDRNVKLIFEDEGARICIKENCFENIVQEDIAKHPTYVKINNNGSITKADFTTNENGGFYNFGGGPIKIPPNSRIYYNQESGEPPQVTLKTDPEINSEFSIMGEFPSANGELTTGDVTYEGYFFKIDQDEIAGSYPRIKGKVTVSNGKIIKVWEDTTASVDGISHSTNYENTINLCYKSNECEKSGNYFDYENFELGGKGFKSQIEENNIYGISLTPENGKNSIVKELNMQREIILYPKGGKIKVEKVSKIGEDLSLNIRTQGGFRIENGKYVILNEGGEIYSEIKRDTNILQDNMKVTTDVRLEILEKNNNVRIYDLNTGKTSTKKISKEGIERRKQELAELQDLKQILEQGKVQIQNKDIDWNRVDDYLDLQIAERNSELQHEEEIINPVFGEVISTKNIKVSSSNFFTNEIIRKEDINYFIGADEYTGAAIIVASKPEKYDPSFDVASITTAKDLANNGYYVLQVEGIISEYPDFLNMLEDPNLHKFGPDLKINEFDVFSHSWEGGLWLEKEEGIYAPKVENYLYKIDKIDYYYKYLSTGGLRTTNFKSLSDDQIKFIKDNLAPNAIIRYKGCNLGNIPSMASTTYDILQTKVEASPVGTYMQKYDNKHGVWTAFELDDSGNIIYSSRPDKYSGKRIKAPKDKIFREGDIVRMNPNIHLLGRDYNQENFPGITGYITIVDFTTKSGTKYYKIEYPTTMGIETVWIDQFGDRKDI